MKNIVMIGMPGSGKSTVGMTLARALSMNFVDADDLIRRREGMTLEQIIDAQGLAAFRDIEEDVNASIVCENTVIAPGGSVIYGPRAMAHLREIATVVYLQLSCERLALRLGDLKARGVAIAPGMTLLDLYNERCPLYEKYAHAVCECDGLTLNQVVEKCKALVQAN